MTSHNTKRDHYRAKVVPCVHNQTRTVPLVHKPNTHLLYLCIMYTIQLQHLIYSSVVNNTWHSSTSGGWEGKTDLVMNVLRLKKSSVHKQLSAHLPHAQICMKTLKFLRLKDHQYTLKLRFFPVHFMASCQVL